MGLWDDYSADVKIGPVTADTGVNTVDGFGDNEAKGAIWKYVIDKGGGANMRIGEIGAVWDLVADSVPGLLPDEMSDDIGTAIGEVSFVVDKSGNTVRLRLTALSDGWEFRAVRTLLGVA